MFALRPYTCPAHTHIGLDRNPARRRSKSDLAYGGGGGGTYYLKQDEVVSFVFSLSNVDIE